MINLLLRWASTVNELNRLLRMKFIEGNKHINHPIGLANRNVIQHYNEGNYPMSELELARMQFLVRHLHKIERHDEKMLEDFRKIIIKQPENFTGIRFEIGIAASLINKKINFYKQESPDFKITDKRYDAVFIECGSSNLTERKDNDLNYKIGSVIRKKGKKKYANQKTALFIDVTNIFFALAQMERTPNPILIKDYVSELLKEFDLGNVTLFSYMMNTNLQRYESSYIRVDSKKIDSNLLLFMNQNYPISGYLIRDPLFPYNS